LPNGGVGLPNVRRQPGDVIDAGSGVMTASRRQFLLGSAAVTLAVAESGSPAATLDPDVLSEMHRRLKFLAPPDGVPAFGAFPSPPVRPFADPVFIPPRAEPLIDLTSPQWRGMSDAEWWKAFVASFETAAQKLRLHGVDIGSPPIPAAHQRFYELRPQKFYVLREREFRWQFHSDYGSASWNWGFETISLAADGSPQFSPSVVEGNHGSSPGPTFHARYGEPILVRRINGLPEVGTSTGDAHLGFALPSTTTHLHNAHTASESDGYPGDWINPGEYWDHHYGNFPSGHDDREKLATLWYHDHRMDFTASNVYAGLDGFYLLFDEADTGDDATGWNLPAAGYDIPLILHDLAFAPDGDGRPQLVFDGFNTDGIIGDRYTVNRIIQPSLKVEPRKYRLRLLDGGPSRFYELVLYDRIAKLDHPFIVITGDGNFQPNPLIADSIYLGVAQRVDVILDFSKYQVGDHLYLVNQLLQTNGKGPSGIRIKPDPHDMQGYLDANSVMRFEVVPSQGVDRSAFPLTFRDLPNVDLTEVVRERLWVFDYEGGLWTINGQIFDPNRVDAGIEQDSAEIWTFRNNGNGWHHPIHSHFSEFIILEINGKPQFQANVQTAEAPGDAALHHAFADAAALNRAFGKLRGRAGIEPSPGVAPGVMQRLLALPAATQQQIREGRHDALRFHSYDEFLIFAELFKQLGLGDLMLDRFMGGPRRDVALLLPTWEVKVFMRWKDFLGKHVMHCHNVVHEDHAMMIRWEIVPRGRGFDTPQQVGKVAEIGKRVSPAIRERVEDVPARASAAGPSE
jgi:FtsP/CotA-like multicopper oxidase with cupredoxin domain